MKMRLFKTVVMIFSIVFENYFTQPVGFRNLAVTLTELMGILIGSWYPRKMQGLHLQLKLWNAIGIVLVIAYSSNLAATLTSCRYEKKIDTTRDFVEANLTWGKSGEVGLKFFLDLTDRYHNRIAENFVPENEATDRHAKVLQGNYAIIGTTVSDIFVPDETFDNKDLTGYRLMKEATSDLRLTFVAQPWLVGPVNEIIIRLLESGLVEYQIEDVFHRRIGLALREVLVDYDQRAEGPTVLGLISLGTGFLTLMIGSVTSAVVFILELRSCNKQRSIRQAFVEIKKRRAIWYANEQRANRADARFREFCRTTLGYTVPRFHRPIE